MTRCVSYHPAFLPAFALEGGREQKRLAIRKSQSYNTAMANAQFPRLSQKEALIFELLGSQECYGLELVRHSRGKL